MTSVASNKESDEKEIYDCSFCVTNDKKRSILDSEAVERHAEIGSSSGRIDGNILAQTDTLASVDVKTGLFDGYVVLQSHFGLLQSSQGLHRCMQLFLQYAY